MELIKTNEKIMVWMFRTGRTGQDISNKIGITRQAWSSKLKNNVFTTKDIIVLKSMGFDG